VGKQKSQEYVPAIPEPSSCHAKRSDSVLINVTCISDLHLLAVSTHMTELSYSISDIQTRIFGPLSPCMITPISSLINPLSLSEIQELRHKSQSSTGDAAGTTTSIIDQALINLDERLETVAAGMKAVSDSLEPVLQTPTFLPPQGSDSAEIATVLRKHAALVTEWDALQDESEVLREELKEDKWLTVFRTVTDQADGMMSSLEKAVNRCQVYDHRPELYPDVTHLGHDRNSSGRRTDMVSMTLPRLHSQIHSGATNRP
jgi:hypothetical protein